ncbi:hypothetical protein A9267_05740 [Shewanella sp. UCD-FRSSP16_17]|uniref:hypothetical protein n=1 Tax=unclassified Shewanella TaxID=196818 RepID=UPI0007EE9FE0|nr:MULTISPECIES: hypothetical protein [unclassified Shewanella]MBQ4891124.1 hypothetical protein [Shewanella sp. MMG014]OBT10379.1 hypothetical protein A9267_05740 [Shewanella sp. UCD-FRSSP16_17]
MFEFKGNRNYLHGTDFYRFTLDYAAQHMPENTRLSQLSFRKLARFQCELTTQRPDTGTVVATGKFSPSDGDTVPLWWVEGNTLVEGRYEFDEDELVANAELTISPATIKMHKPVDDYTCIEVLVALTKKMHNQIAPLSKGKWLFGQLNLTQNLPTEYQSAEIKLQSMLHGKFSVSEVWLDGVKLGQIRFIVEGQ